MCPKCGLNIRGGPPVVHEIEDLVAHTKTASLTD